MIYNVTFNSFGPEVIRSDPKYKASDYYFPTSENPFRIDMNNGCYLSLTDNNRMVVWESEFSNSTTKAYIVDTFTGFDADPDEWDTDGIFGGSRNRMSPGLVRGSQSRHACCGNL